MAGDARYLRRNAKAVNISNLRDAWEEYSSESRMDKPSVYLPKISPAPLLIVQGLKDQFVPPESTAKLWTLAAHPKKMAEFPDEDHGFYHDRPAVTTAVCGWLDAKLRQLSEPSLPNPIPALQEA
jgi:pimeloyl-ACP methyl ester carboxylesterase